MKAITVVLLLLSTSLLQAEAAPNFLIIYADDLGYTQTSVPMMKNRPELAHKLHQTPHLEKLASRGMRFSNAYAPSPVCTPSRASLQFGMTTARVGCISIHDVVMHKRKIDMSKYLSIAEMLKQADKNYLTGFFGKGCTPMHWFKDHGYDVTDFIHRHPNGNAHGDWWEPTKKTPIPVDDPKRVFSLAKTSVDFLTKRAEDKRPFYLMISHYAVHVRNVSLKSTRAKYLKILAERREIAEGIPDNRKELSGRLAALWEEANYAAMMENMDSSIGIVLDKLKELGLEKNTYVIFSSDNGGGSSNAPLQGGKAKMWEGGLRVPMIVAGPSIAPNSQCDRPVAQWDYLPTMHDLAGSKIPLPKNLDGISLRPVLEKGNAGKLAKRDPGFVFHFPAHYTTPVTAFREGDYKLMRHLNTGEVKLFNVAKDMGETKELSAQMPVKVADMILKLDAYLKKVGAWKMDEVYQVRQQELRDWIKRAREHIAKIQRELGSGTLDKNTRKERVAEIERLRKNQERHRQVLEQVSKNAFSKSWF